MPSAWFNIMQRARNDLQLARDILTEVFDDNARLCVKAASAMTLLNQTLSMGSSYTYRDQRTAAVLHCVRPLRDAVGKAFGRDGDLYMHLSHAVEALGKAVASPQVEAMARTEEG